MKIYMMTDLEGVAGVRDFAEWTSPDSRHYDVARELLTLELNAAVDGFFSAGASYILVVDGHGPGAIDITKLDSRVDLLRGAGTGWPLELGRGFDALAFVGQHAKSRTPFSNMTHTQCCPYLELSINGKAIGEFGQLAMCASELGIRTIFAAGELALTKEAQDLVPGIETVSVKEGTVPGRGDECTEEQYRHRNRGAIHIHPQRAREMIRQGAIAAIQRAEKEDFGLIPLTPPFKRIAVFRGKEDNPQRTYSVAKHSSSVIEVMNMPFDKKPIESDKHLAELLVD